MKRRHSRTGLRTRIRWAIIRASAWTIAGGTYLILTSWHQGVTPW